MPSNTQRTPTSRRGLLAATAAVVGALAGCSAVGTTPQTESATGASTNTSTSPTDTSATSPVDPAVLGGHLDGVDNFDGEIVDKRNRETVTVAVGAAGNNGHFAFSPPAVHVVSGTTVRWKWLGKEGSHNVDSEHGSFSSGSPVSDAGVHFEHTFDEDGVYPYACDPHRAFGMKGAVVVGTDFEPLEPSEARTETTRPKGEMKDFGGWMAEVSNYNGVVDRTGNEEAHVTVGAKGNGGNYAFAPPAIKIEPGTTVIWTWTGKGGPLGVTSQGTIGGSDTADDDSEPLFRSERVDEEGHTFSHTFTERGTYKYGSVPHLNIGMRGVIEVV